MQYAKGNFCSVLCDIVTQVTSVAGIVTSFLIWILCGGLVNTKIKAKTYPVSAVMQLNWQWDMSAYINQINIQQYKSPYVRAYFLVHLVSVYYYLI